jgi:glycerol 2-dehydrogenase (NADP+)
VTPATILISLQANIPNTTGIADNLPSTAENSPTSSSVLPKSVTQERIKCRFAMFYIYPMLMVPFSANTTIVQLSEDEIASLLSIGDSHSFRSCDPEWTGWGHRGFPDRVKAAEEGSKEDV